MALLGDGAGRGAIVALQVAALGITILFTYLLGVRIVGPWAGLLAAAMLAVSPQPANQTVLLNTSVLGACLVTGLLLLLWRCMVHPTAGRALVLGVALGAAALTLAPTVMIGPVIAVALAVEAVRRRSLRPLTMTAIVALTSMLVIAPWTIRNARTFGTFIPIQTGLGNFANFTNTYLAETFMPELALDPAGSPPPWTSTGSLHAVREICSYKVGRSRALINRSLASVEAAAPPHWGEMNEPQRDKAHLAQFKQFVAEHPGVFAQLVASKSVVLAFLLAPAMLPVSLAAVVGVFVALRRRGGYLLPLTIVMMCWPLLITAPMFYRYRLPVEPLVMLLAAGTAVALVQMWTRRRSPASDPVALHAETLS